MQFLALAKQEEAASKSLVGLTLGLFYYMKMTFEKEMFLLNGVIDLWYVDIHRRRNSVVRTNCTPYG